jgi:hypothetical protein
MNWSKQPPAAAVIIYINLFLGVTNEMSISFACVFCPATLCLGKLM